MSSVHINVLINKRIDFVESGLTSRLRFLFCRFFTIIKTEKVNTENYLILTSK